ncbi:uncharacterized protein BXZ73DRAFT_44391 [Epithele typhae]|uniref:uncharacterized protein n=1 Tax=Epithele typhae TaxID=378194 RepID=UPI002008DE43|nr:uncharacterized protein BXZ73DRAFT_44391 [Epithele typhae]KAH9938790.1 hypothetical protein BXZ73DRAFT_44391 [Epithele typhae]
MSDGESELTELDFEDGEDYAPSGQSKGKGKVIDLDDYKIHGALKVPRAATFTCQHLHQQIHGGDINLQPEYQRDARTCAEPPPGLIDSIFRNYYIPPVIFVVHSSDDGGERRTCVDGKQRLTSIHRCVTVSAHLCLSISNVKFVFKDIGMVKNSKVLPERYQKLFMTKQVVCMEYSDITEENEREIFQRVQLGMALTPAEKLQAITGEQNRFVRKVMDEYVAEKLAVYMDWETARGNDFRMTAVAIYCILLWPGVTYPTVPVLEKWLRDETDIAGEPDELEEVNDVFKVYCALAQDERLSACFRLKNVKKVAPIEFVAVALLIHSQMRKMSLAQLSAAVTAMRQDIRKDEKDIRQNTRCMKLLMSWILKTKPSRFDVDPANIVVAYDEVLPEKAQLLSKSKTKKVSTTTSKSTVKRKRSTADPGASQ